MSLPNFRFLSIISKIRTPTTKCLSVTSLGFTVYASIFVQGAEIRTSMFETVEVQPLHLILLFHRLFLLPDSSCYLLLTIYSLMLAPVCFYPSIHIVFRYCLSSLSICSSLSISLSSPHSKSTFLYHNLCLDILCTLDT